MLGAVLAVVQPTPVSSVLTLRDDSTVAGPELRLADVADLTTLPVHLCARASELVLARFALRDRSFGVRDSDIIAKAKARLPDLAPWLPLPSGKVIRVSIQTQRAESGSAANDKGCVRAVRPIAAGAVPSRDDFDLVPCEAASPRSFRYEASLRTVRTVRAVAEGEVVRPWPDFGSDRIAAGQSLTLKAFIGPVSVEREVVAAQSALPGQHVFVRNSDGAVQSVRYEVVR
jgi:hypothetical protein